MREKCIRIGFHCSLGSAKLYPIKCAILEFPQQKHTFQTQATYFPGLSSMVGRCPCPQHDHPHSLCPWLDLQHPSLPVLPALPFPSNRLSPSHGALAHVPPP